MSIDISVTSTTNPRFYREIPCGTSVKETNAQRRSTVENLFKGFKEMGLAESLTEMGIPDAATITRMCTQRVADPQMAFLVAYTFDWGKEDTYEQNPWRVLNKALVDGSNVERFKVCGFLYGVLKAVRQLPLRRYTRLYRGVSRALEWRVGEVRELAGFTSTTPNEGVARGFMGGEGTLVRIHWAIGTDVQEYSYFEKGKEEEVVVEPLTSVVVTGVEGDVVDVVWVEPKEYLLGGMIWRRECEEDDLEKMRETMERLEKAVREKEEEMERVRKEKEEEIGRLEKTVREMEEEMKEKDEEIGRLEKAVREKEEEMEVSRWYGILPILAAMSSMRFSSP